MGHNRKTNKNSNRYFSNKYQYTGTNPTLTKIRLTSYDYKNLETKDIDKNLKTFRDITDENKINWFRIEGFNDDQTITRLVKEFGVNSLDVRDILTPHHVVKIDDDDKYIMIIFNTCSYTKKNQVLSEHICIIVTEHIVISISESNRPLFNNVDTGLKNNTMNIRNQKSGMLLAFLLNSIIAEIIETSSKVEEQLEHLESCLLSKTYDQKDIGLKIQQCRHAYLIVRKNTRPIKDDFFKLLKIRDRVITKTLIPIFDELSEQLEYIIQSTENSKEMLSSLVELYVSDGDQKTNLVMKRLTVVSTLFIPITFLVGVWGMNFSLMPELNWKYGYLIAWIAILATAIGTWLFMKKKNWF